MNAMDMSALLLRSQKFAEDMNLYFILDQFSLSCMAVKTNSNVLNFKVKTALLKTWERFYLKLWLEDYKFKIFTVLIKVHVFSIWKLYWVISWWNLGKNTKLLSNFNNAYIIADIYSWFFFILSNSLKNFQMFFYLMTFVLLLVSFLKGADYCTFPVL